MTTNDSNIAFIRDSERKGSGGDCPNYELFLALCHSFCINPFCSCLHVHQAYQKVVMYPPINVYPEGRQGQINVRHLLSSFPHCFTVLLTFTSNLSQSTITIENNFVHTSAFNCIKEVLKTPAAHIT